MPGKKLEKKKQKQLVKARKRRTIYLSVGLGAALVVILAAYYFATLPHNSATGTLAYIGEPVPAGFYSTLVGLSQQTYGGPLLNVSTNFSFYQSGYWYYYSQQYHKIEKIPYNATYWSVGGKPVVVYIGAEWCPFCAATRWPLVLALLRFGNFTGLEYMVSAPPTQEPIYNLPTFTFRNTTYSSPYIVFQAYEVENRDRVQIRQPPPNYSAVWSLFGSGYPFIDFANRYALPGSPVGSEWFKLIENYNWSQVVALIQSNTSVGVQMRAAANAITAAICSLDGNRPSNVCSRDPIPKLEAQLAQAPGAHSPLALSPSDSFTAGYPSATTVAWTTVQYRQIEWIRATSVKTR